MAQTQTDMATQSLPSFAQTFGGPSLTRMPEVNNALPPIQHRPPPLDRSRSAHTSPQPSSTSEHKQNVRKRLHSESTIGEAADAAGTDDRRSPHSVRVKEEIDADSIPPPKHAASQQGGAPREISSSSSSPNPNPSKKRRMTITGINTDVRRPSVDSGISPVVMGLTIPPGDATALEQVRSMVNLKHQQQALIESRRGSLASIVPPTAPPDVNIVNSLTAPDDRTSSAKPVTSVRASRRSPNLSAVTGHRGSIVAASSTAPTQQQQQQPPPHPPTSAVPSERQPTPPPAAATITIQRTQPRPATDSPPMQPQSHPPHVSGSSPHLQPPVHALPPPSISFARRRASRHAGLKGKPADIMVNPRNPEGDLQPIIQSAPPIPRGGQSQSLPGRFPLMALPSVPPVMVTGQLPKRISTAQVPPTPTRLSIARQAIGGGPAAAPGRSPPAASVPISSTLVPPTPASLHHPGYTGERSAFLAPFEAFYDALNDSKQLKGWLGEQLHKSNTLIAALQRQQEQMEEAVHQLVDRKVAAMRGEVYDLKMRVDELEHQLRNARAQGYGGGAREGGSGSSPRMAKEKGKTNGYAAVVPETYHFPPIDHALRRPELVRRVSSPAGSETQSVSQTGSPVPFEIGKRLSVSAMRHDPQPTTRAAQRAERERELPQTLPPHPHINFAASNASAGGSGSGGGGKSGWSPRTTKMSLPSLSVRPSLSHTTTTRRSSIDRGTGGHSRQGSTSNSRMMAHPPEKRQASRSPDADEEGRHGPSPKHLAEQRRASVGVVQHHHKRGHGHGYVGAAPRSPMDTS